jgi:hypothetical protein
MFVYHSSREMVLQLKKTHLTIAHLMLLPVSRQSCRLDVMLPMLPKLQLYHQLTPPSISAFHQK